MSWHCNLFWAPERQKGAQKRWSSTQTKKHVFALRKKKLILHFKQPCDKVKLLVNLSYPSITACAYTLFALWSFWVHKAAAAAAWGRRIMGRLQTHCRLPCNKMEDMPAQGARWAIRRTNWDSLYHVYTYSPAPGGLNINQKIYKCRYGLDKLLTECAVERVFFFFFSLWPTVTFLLFFSFLNFFPSKFNFIKEVGSYFGSTSEEIALSFLNLTLTFALESILILFWVGQQKNDYNIYFMNTLV